MFSLGAQVDTGRRGVKILLIRPAHGRNTARPLFGRGTRSRVNLLGAEISLHLDSRGNRFHANYGKHM